MLSTSRSKSARDQTGKASRKRRHRDPPKDEIKTRWCQLSQLTFVEDEVFSSEHEKIYQVYMPPSLNWSIVKLASALETIGLGNDYLELKFDSVKEYPTLTAAKKIELEEYISVASLFFSGTRLSAKPCVKIGNGKDAIYRFYIFYKAILRTSFSSNIKSHFESSTGFLASTATENQPYVEFNPGKYDEWVTAVQKEGDTVSPALSPSQFVELIHRRIQLIKPNFQMPDYITCLLPQTLSQTSTPTSSSSSTSRPVSSTSFLTRQLAPSQPLPELIVQLETFLDKAKSEQSHLDQGKKEFAHEKQQVETDKANLEKEKASFSVVKTQFELKQKLLDNFEYHLLELVKLGIQLKPEMASHIITHITSLNPNSEEMDLLEEVDTNGFLQDDEYRFSPS